MSFSMENTSFITTETELDEGVPTHTSSGIITPTSETIITPTSETIITETTIEETDDIPTEDSYLNYAPITTEVSTSTSADKLTPYTITQEPTTESSMISNTQPATDDSSSSIDNLSVAVIAVLIVIGISLLIALITLCVTLSLKKRKQERKRRITPIPYFEPTTTMNSSKDDNSFYVNSTDYYRGANMSFVVDKPERTYSNDTFHTMESNTTHLFPPARRTHQEYTSPRQSVLSRQELINYGRESNQTMGGRKSRYRPSLHDSIFIGSTRQNSTCSSYYASIYSNKQDQHKMTLWDDDLIDAWSTEDKQTVKKETPSINGPL